MNQIKSFIHNATILLFGLAITLPGIILLINPDREASITERRPLAQAPKLNEQGLEDFIRDFETYFNDQLGFREEIIRFNNIMKVRFLEISPVQEVIVGQDGWLYLEETLDFHRGLVQWDPHQLEQWKTALQMKHDYFTNRGIQYIFVVAPNKSTIYPEYIPSRYTQIKNTSYLGQLFAELETHSDVTFVDLRNPLLAEKGNHLLYHKYDTHWNNHGAYVAYQTLLDHLDIKPLAPDQIYSVMSDSPNDLLDMLGIVDSVFPLEFGPLIAPKESCSTWDIETFDQQQGQVKRIGWSECPQAAQNNILIFHDSFFNFSALALLDQHFRQSVFIHTSYNHWIAQELIDELKPSIIIEEIVERDIKKINPFLTMDELTRQITFENLPDILLEISPDVGFDLLNLEGVDSTEIIKDGLRFTAETTPPRLSFTLQDNPLNGHYALKVVISTPEYLQLTMKYALEDQTCEKGNSLSISNILLPRRNTMHFTIDNANLIKCFAMDFGGILGTYTIHEIIVRGTRS